MATRSFTLRSSPGPAHSGNLLPPRGGERQEWEAETGDALARNRSRLKRARFVRESPHSKPWSAADSPERTAHTLSVVDESSQCSPEPAQISAPSAGGLTESDPALGADMASFYARLASSIGERRLAPSTSPAKAHAAALPPTQMPTIRPGKARTTSTKAQCADWFIQKASAQMQRQSASSLDCSDDAATLVSFRSQGVAEAETDGQSTRPCPTCSFSLPWPCADTVLQSHLRSMAHRLALASTIDPTPPESTAAKAPAVADHNREVVQGGTATAPPLHLTAQNLGYRLLADMGWREGCGLGSAEWDWLQRQRQQDATETTLAQTASAQVRGSISGSWPHSEEDDNVVAHRRARTSPDGDEAVQASGTEASSRQPQGHETRKPPRLVPIAVRLKTDRLGIGRQTARGRGSRRPSQARASDPSPKRADHAQAYEENKRKWLDLRSSLN